MATKKRSASKTVETKQVPVTQEVKDALAQKGEGEQLNEIEVMTDESATVQNAEVAQKNHVVHEKKAETVEVVVKEAKLYEIKFIKDHKFSIGIEPVNAKKDDKIKVEKHIANRLSSRGIAVLTD